MPITSRHTMSIKEVFEQAQEALPSQNRKVLIFHRFLALALRRKNAKVELYALGLLVVIVLPFQTPSISYWAYQQLCGFPYRHTDVWTERHRFRIQELALDLMFRRPIRLIPPER